MFKRIMKSSFIGISCALIIFNIICLIFDLTNNGSFHLENYQYTRMLAGTVVIALGFGLPAFIYGNDRVPYALQVVFHMGIGCAVMLITAFAVGWIPTDRGPLVIILTIAVEIAVAFIVWIIISVIYKKEADKINKKLKSEEK
ncbi:MAG: DUF3021 domain-containing protein [Lachnospiraceae bacterium]|jgi:uncharacterized membrane protein (DUF485 family)